MVYGIDPRNLDLGTSWRWVVSFTPRSLYPREKSPRYPLERRLSGAQNTDSNDRKHNPVQPRAGRANNDQYLNSGRTSGSPTRLQAVAGKANEPTPRRWVLEKPPVAQLLKNFQWNPRVHYSAHKSPPLNHNLSQMNLARTAPSYFPKIRINIILPHASRSS
jgi:hypothetical protein